MGIIMNEKNRSSKVFSETYEQEQEKAREIDMPRFSIPPDVFKRALLANIDIALKSGRKDEREDMVCRLLASEMPVEEIAVVLNLRVDAVQRIENIQSEGKIPKYAKNLKERRHRRQNPIMQKQARALDESFASAL